MVRTTKNSSLMPLTDLMSLHPWKTPPPPFPENQNGKYIKLKKPLVKDGARVYWQAKEMQREEVGDWEIEIPYEGFFEFVDKRVIKTIRLWIDRLVGELFGLPKVR